MSQFSDTLKQLNLLDETPPDSSLNSAKPPSSGPQMKNSRLKSWLKKPAVKIIITLILLSGAAYSGYNYFSSAKQKENNSQAAITSVAKTVSTVVLSSGQTTADLIEAVGVVKPQREIDIVALTGGTIVGLFFEVGDLVSTNQVLARLSNKATEINLLNAQTNLINQENNLSATVLITRGNTRQAEISLSGSQEAVRAAEIALKNTQDNLANSIALRGKSNLDIKNNAIISFNSHLNTINNTLDQVNYLIKAEGNLQMPGIAETLSIKDAVALNKVKNDYFITKNSYNSLKARQPSVNTISVDMTEMITALALAKQLTDQAIVVLDNTISNPNFSDSALSAQKNNFSALRTNIINARAGAESSLQTLENLILVEKQEIDTLTNAVAAAQSQLETARTSQHNALSSLDIINQNNQLQIISARSAVDAARSQLNLARVQASDLTIKSPLSGQITAKAVELGSEVNNGQAVARLAQTDIVVIEVDLAVDDIKKIKIGQAARINSATSELKGQVNKIYPAADPASKKVRVEIIFGNKDKALIPQSFVNIYLASQTPVMAQENIFLIPLKAITVAAGENYLFLVVDGKAKKTAVELGPSEGELVNVLAGLSLGDEVIIEGAKNLQDGEIVNTKQQNDLTVRP